MNERSNDMNTTNNSTATLPNNPYTDMDPEIMEMFGMVDDWTEEDEAKLAVPVENKITHYRGPINDPLFDECVSAVLNMSIGRKR